MCDFFLPSIGQLSRKQRHAHIGSAHPSLSMPGRIGGVPAYELCETEARAKLDRKRRRQQDEQSPRGRMDGVATAGGPNPWWCQSLTMSAVTVPSFFPLRSLAGVS